MATYKRLPRGKMKSHDEFVDWTVHALIWLRENWRTAAELLAVGAVAFVVVVGASNYWTYRSGVAAEALYAAGRLEAGSEAQVAALEKVAGSYSRTPAGQQALMQLGNGYFEQKDYDKAIEKFRILAGRSRNRAILNIAALHRIADAELAKGNFTAAAETYLKAAADPHNEVGPMSRFRAAACFERAGDYERAATLYRQVIGDAKDDDKAARDGAEERLLWLSINKHIAG